MLVSFAAKLYFPTFTCAAWVRSFDGLGWNVGSPITTSRCTPC